MEDNLVNAFENLDIKSSQDQGIKIIWQIYIATCLTSKKSYVGKTKSHRMDKGKLRPFGFKKTLG